MKRYSPFCNLSFLAFLIFLVASFGVKPSLAQLNDPDDLASIWNASTVDWWVSAGDDVSETCQIHWLYDDKLNVYLRKNAQDHYYFGIDDMAPDSSESFSSRGALNAYLIVDDSEVDLGVERIGDDRIVAVVPPSLNTLDYLRKSKILLLKSGGVLFNFPLENWRENFEVYGTCLEDHGQVSQSVIPVELEPVSIPDVGDLNAPDETLPQHIHPKEKVEYDTKGLGLFGEPAETVDDSLSISEEQSENNVLRANEDSPVVEEMALSEESKEIIDDALGINRDVNEEYPAQAQAVAPPPPFHKKVKQSDDLEQGLEGIDLVSEDKNSRKPPEKEFKGGRHEYDAKSTSIIRNLTRKLSILEKEKESLRKNLLVVDDRSVVSEIAACNNAVSENQEDAVLSEDLIEEFEVIISSLRAENELLNAAVLDGDTATNNIADAADTSSLKEKIDELNQQVNDLKFENSDLNKAIDDYRSMMDEWQKGEAVTDDQKKRAVDEAVTFDADAILDAAEADWGDEIERDVMDQALDILSDPIDSTDIDQE